jgi:acetyl esterase/lipase
MNANPIHPGHPQEIPLWAEGEIDTTGWNQPEGFFTMPGGMEVIRNVSRPTLTVYLPDPQTATGAGVVVCPGGAYHLLAYRHEGIEVAKWLNQHGIAAFVLKYRLVQTGDDFPQCVDERLDDPKMMAEIVEPIFPMENADGCQAVRMVREHASEWGIDPDRIGIMGFSAGGMLALQVTLRHDETSRPNFAAPIYSAPPPEGPLPVDAPPLFLLCAADDDMASAVSIEYYAHWRSAGKPVEMHIYAKGGHGFGMNTLGLPSDRWIERFYDWMKEMGFLK